MKGKAYRFRTAANSQRKKSQPFSSFYDLRLNQNHIQRTTEFLDREQRSMELEVTVLESQTYLV